MRCVGQRWRLHHAAGLCGRRTAASRADLQRGQRYILCCLHRASRICSCCHWLLRLQGGCSCHGCCRRARLCSGGCGGGGTYHHIVLLRLPLLGLQLLLHLSYACCVLQLLQQHGQVPLLLVRRRCTMLLVPGQRGLLAPGDAGSLHA